MDTLESNHLHTISTLASMKSVSGKFSRTHKQMGDFAQAKEAQILSGFVHNNNGKRVITGPLSFIAHCVSMAYQDAVNIMDYHLHMQGASSVTWLLLPDIRKWVNIFADEVIKEIYVQVRQEEWFLVHCSAIELSLPSTQTVTQGAEEMLSEDAHEDIDVHVGVDDEGMSSPDTKAASLSYIWLTMMTSHFIQECWGLLHYVPASATSPASSSTTGIDILNINMPCM